jgi:hypothetical protein
VIPEAFDARFGELLGREVRSINLAPFGAGRHIGCLELERWLETHPQPSIVAVEVGVTSDVVESPQEFLSRFESPSDALRLIATAPYVYRDSKEQKRKADREPLFDPLGLFAALDRRTLHVELALDVFGRGPEDCVRAAFNRAVSGGPYWMPGRPDLPAIVSAQVAERGYYRVTPDSPLGLGGKPRLEQRNREISYEDALAQTPSEDKSGFEQPDRHLPAKLYARRIAEICRGRGIRLVFVEQPNYRGRALRPSQIELYRSLGELFQPDRTVLFRESSFQDPGHLSVEGAEFLSRSLAEHLAR